MGKERNNYQIGIYLEKALNEKNMSIKQLSNFTSISARLLSRYLINEKCPSLTNIQKIANALDKDIEYFTNDFYFENKNMKEILMNSTILLHIANNTDDSNSKAFKASIKLMKQIFNSSTAAGRKKLLDEFIIFLSDKAYDIAYEDKNGVVE
ncbi:helix-turn-helix transcriptional regulator [Holdemanella porci]|uniref:helix-turn-helix domain-containing protein n=1 Tax=Holdemanella porci TaxID=2652276 RepID=UPI002FDD61A3